MKNLNFKWLLLSFILSIASINTAFAASKRVYCKMTQSWWTNGDATGGASIGAYAWKSSDASQKNAAWPGVRMTWTERDGEWYIDLDTKYDKVIFTRVNSAPNALEDWGAKTGDLSVSEGNYYTITTSTSTWSPSTCSGSWKTVSKPSVTLTIEKVSTDQITLCGTITSGGNDGTNASDMIEVGFKIGATTYNSSITKSGTSFRKTITGLSANTTYSNIKAYATNVVGTTETSAQSATTLANTTYRIQVQVAHGGTAPKIYAWRADDYGGNNTETNAAYASSPAMSLLFAASTYDWYYYDMHNKYDKFLLKNNNSNDNGKTADILTPREAKCYWYTDSNGNYGEMDCPSLTPQLIIKAKGAGSDTRVDMSGDGTKTVDYTLSAGTTYLVKIMYNTEYYGKGDSDESSAIARTGSTSSNSISGLAVGKSYIKLTADLGGTYTFNFNTSGNVLSVTYPTAYQITYSATTVGSGTGNSAAPTATYNSGATSVTSGTTWIPTGTTVAFSAKSANAGYTFKGWYSGTPNPANWSTNRIQEGAAYNRVVSATATIYAVYDENDYTVTVTKTSGGSIASTSVTGHKSTKVTLPTATPDPGYYFTGWTTTVGSLTYTNQSSATAAQVNGLTAAATVQANFAPIWRIACSDDGYNTTTKPITNITTSAGAMTSGYVEVSLAANTDYEFKVFQANDANPYWGKTSTITKITYVNKATAVTLTHNSGNNQTFRTAAAGTYRFTWDVTNSQITLGYPTSYLITSGQKTFYNEDASSDASETGGTYTAVDNSSNNVKGANKYVAASASVTFTATPKDGYTFAGWYTNSTCTTPYTSGTGVTISDNVLTLSSIGANKVVYAKFEEIMSTVTIDALYGGEIYLDPANPSNLSGETPVASHTDIKVGKHTTHTIVAKADNAHYFKEWQLSLSPKFTISDSATDEDNINITVTGTGVSGYSSLCAYFEILESIYFRNKFDDGTNPEWSWDNVYAFFDVSWNDGNHCAVTSANNSSKSLHVQMEAIGTTGIYRAYIPRYATRNNKTKVAFADYDVSGNSTVFNPGSGTHHGSYRADYSPKHNMFVPYHVKETNDGYWTQYYNKGYWMHYTISENVDAGYWIERHTGTKTYSGKPSDQFVILERAFEPQPRIRYRLRIDGLNKDQYAIFSEGGLKYKANETITFNNCTDIAVVEDNGSDAYFTLTPTAEGEYILTIDQSGDQMKLSVEYPIVAGDYVIENAYDDGTAKTTRTNIIKSANAGTKTRYSMYLNNAGSGTLKLRKCNSIDGSGKPVWSAGDDTNLSGILSDGDFTPGVYQFDITINTSTDKVSEVDSVRLYTGNFYIKTDAASGGWVSYKNNALTKNTVNFDREDETTFDYYMCKYFASKDCNIKSVIANDYCNQLSDTVKGDGIARMEGKEPFVPVNGTSIRFSYNSATNETKRAYLGASANNDFLNIDVSTDDKIYRDITVAEVTTETDMYGISGYDNLWKTRFNDNGNWVYEMDVKVKPSGKAGVTAAYTDAGSTKHVQTLIPNTNTVLGGSESSDNKYSIRIVYDFKTNFMMSSFVLTETEIGENLSDFDMLWVRHKDKSATQLTLGTGKKLTNVRPIGAIEFRYDSVCNDASHSGTGWVDMHLWTPQNRPFLKYFVSFPFDVEVNSIFGLNQARYGIYYDYVIQKYNGAKRAKDGLFFGDDNNYWENVQPGDTLKANEGYCVIFDNEYVAGLSGSKMWENKASGSRVYLYFPAMKEVASITNDNTTTTVDPHTCTIDRAWSNNAKKNHKYTDSHWSLIGNPLFHDAYIKDFTNGGDSILKSYYYMDLTSVSSSQDWQTATVTKGSTQLKAMSSVLVQWFGTINWGTSAGALAAPRRTNDEKDYLAQLEIAYNGVYADQTFVKLSEEADTAFVLREDMCKVLTTARPNIYTFAGDYDVAYNEMPIESCTVPVGVLARRTGTYTFSMPKNFSGTVTLIDKFDGTRTNLAIEDYEVDLEKGTIDDRFELEINVNKMPTAIDGAEDGSGSLKDGKAHKFIMNGVMYILNDGVLYDATGKRVK